MFFSQGTDVGGGQACKEMTKVLLQIPSNGVSETAHTLVRTEHSTVLGHRTGTGTWELSAAWVCARDRFGFCHGVRGDDSVMFGQPAVDEFLRRNGFSFLIRAHEVCLGPNSGHSSMRSRNSNRRSSATPFHGALQEEPVAVRGGAPRTHRETSHGCPLITFHLLCPAWGMRAFPARTRATARKSRWEARFSRCSARLTTATATAPRACSARRSASASWSAAHPRASFG